MDKVSNPDSTGGRFDDAIGSPAAATSWDVLRDTEYRVQETPRLKSVSQPGFTALAGRMQLLRHTTCTSLRSQTRIRKKNFLFSVPGSLCTALTVMEIHWPGADCEWANFSKLIEVLLLWILELPCAWLCHSPHRTPLYLSAACLSSPLGHDLWEGRYHIKLILTQCLYSAWSKARTLYMFVKWKLWRVKMKEGEENNVLI